MRRVQVEYHLGPYTGTTVLLVGDHEENGTIYARVRRKLLASAPMTLPMAASYFRILIDEPSEGP